MDAFYASVEQRDAPNLQGSPVVVAQDHERGVVAAASYEARSYGVSSAMSSVKAKKLCPHLIFVPPRLNHYKNVSSQIHRIFKRYTDCIEPLSLDEAFLDVTENKKNIFSAQHVANNIRDDIKRELSLNASAGVSYNKFLAKLASDVNKPNGMFVIPPSDGIRYIHSLKIEQFFGVGRKTAEKFHKLNIRTGADLALKDKLWLINHFGKHGIFFYNIVRGIDDRPVEPNRKRQSVAAEHTFAEDIDQLHTIFAKLEAVFEEAIKRLHRCAETPKTVILKIKYEDFSVISRSKTLSQHTRDSDTLRKAVIELCNPDELFAKKIRLLGISFSNFMEDKSCPIQNEIVFA